MKYIIIAFDILDNVLEWSPVYSVDGDMFVPKINLHEPFNSWYDSSVGSRIDFHNGNIILF